MSNTITLNLDQEFFDKTKAVAEATFKKTQIEAFGEEEAKDKKGFEWEFLQLNDIDWNFDDGELYLSGTFERGTGFVSINFQIPIDLTQKMLEHSIKQMNKLKTVLEAVK